MQANSQLTERQRQFLQKLANFMSQEGRPPSSRELQQLFNFRSPRSVSQFLEALERAGYIQRGSGARNIRLLRTALAHSPDQVGTVTVPVVGTAPCGTPFMAEENIEGYVSVSTRLAPPPHRYFIVRASGNSMDRAGIPDRSLVLVRQKDEAQNGDIVVALIDDSVTIKRLRLFPDHAVLEPESSDAVHRRILLEREFQVQGTVVGCLPNFLGDQNNE